MIKELSELKPKFAPDYCLSFTEKAMYALIDIQENYNSIIESVGIQKLAVFESTGSLTEADEAVKKNIFVKAKELLDSFFAWVKGLFTNLLANIKKHREEVVKKSLENIIIDSFKGENFKEFNMKYSADDKEKWVNAAKNITNGLSVNANKKEIDEASVLDIYNKNLGGEAISDLKSLRENLNVFFKGTETKVDANNAVDMFKAAKEACLGGKIDAEIKNSYNEIKKLVAEYEKELATNKTDENAEETKTILADCRFMISLSTQFVGRYLDMFKAYYNNCYHTCMRIGKYCDKKVEEKPAKEAEKKDDDKQQSVEAKVESFFNWL